MIGRSGVVRGVINANALVVAGKLMGDSISNFLELKAQGRIEGTITTNELVVERKGMFVGESKVRNNSSIIRYIYDNGVGILFCGDLERPGWDYLVRNNPNFINTLRKHGVKILVAPHHGHKSGFPKALFDAIGNVDVVIHSKDTEASKDGTDVSSQYSSMANGHSYYVGNSIYSGKVLTTRSNGHVFIETTGYCNYAIYACTASSNHQRLY